MAAILKEAIDGRSTSPYANRPLVALDAIRPHATRLAALLADRDAAAGELLVALKLCQSYASNTSGGMGAEERLRAIYKLCCRTIRKPERRQLTSSD